MAPSLTLPALSLDICRSSVYAQVGALAVALTGSCGGPWWSVSRFEHGQGFNVTAGPLSLDIGWA